MGISICLRQTQRLSQLQILRQACRIEIGQTLTIKLLLKRFDCWKALYKKAIEGGKIKRYQKYGLDFEYALVAAKDVPDEIRANYGWAFSVCTLKGFDALFAGNRAVRARGEWLLFVIEDMYPDLPARFLEYGAVHERGEQITLGDHNLASKLEFAIANKEGDLEEYIAWFEQNTPAKFADVFNFQMHLEYPDDEEFVLLVKNFCATEEAQKIVRMVKGFRWPPHILEVLLDYKDRNDTVTEMIRRAWDHVDYYITRDDLSLVQLLEKARSYMRAELEGLRSDYLRRSLSMRTQDVTWRERRNFADAAFALVLQNRQRNDVSYFSDVIAAKIADGLPKTGIMSVSFSEALKGL